MEPLISEKTLREQILSVSAVTLWTWRRAGRLAGLVSIQIGARRYYRQADVSAWLQGLAANKN